ncbi:MAG TPA: ornithine cyclodeaminase [Castellaniella sp.]|uniref:ornithine cyclodeaminase n=1 Tax=Castellaniella sp. TaxID=1955812 RepID=UPI002EFE54C9
MKTSITRPRTRLLDTHDVARLLHLMGVPAALQELAGILKEDYLRWPDFDKASRIGAYTDAGVIELMPITDGRHYTFKCVNGHPDNGRYGLPTVMAMGALLDCDTGMIRLLSELTLTTALRTAANSALAARTLARPDSRVMAIIGNGAQSDFQAMAFRALLGIQDLRLYDLDQAASERLQRNLLNAHAFDTPFRIQICDSAAQAIQGADIVSTLTAHQGPAQVLTANMLEPGMHINAVGGDSPGKTELDPAVLPRASVFVEYVPQTREEGEIQQMPADFPVVELWQVLTGVAPGRVGPDQITVFDSVGFALEDYAALRFLRAAAERFGVGSWVDVTSSQDDPRDLFGWWLAQSVHEPEAVRA